MPLPSCLGNTTSADRRPPPPSRPDNTAGVVALVTMAPSPASRWCRHCPPVALVALVFVTLASLSDKMAAERKKLIVESAALASNGDPLIFDAPNELIVGAADIENVVPGHGDLDILLVILYRRVKVPSVRSILYSTT